MWNNPPFLYSQPSYHQPQQVILIKLSSPYHMNFQSNTYMPHLPSSNINHQSMPALQSNYFNQLTSNDDSDFMSRLVRQVRKELKKIYKYNKHNISFSILASSFPPFCFFSFFLFWNIKQKLLSERGWVLIFDSVFALSRYVSFIF